MRVSNDFSRMPKGITLSQAIAEADRCLLCHDAPCSRCCPAETNPAAFIRKLRMKNITGAIRTIKENNILGGACGVLCPTARLCEKECSAVGIDRPIQIGNIQRALIEHAWEIGFTPLKKGAPKKQSVAVVGAGPAGLSCAAELAKRGYPVTVFEAREEAGGVLRYGVVPFRFHQSFLEKELSDITGLGVEFRCNHPIETKGGAEELLSEGFSAVFLAPGLWRAVRLQPELTDVSGLFDAVEWLSAIRRGEVDRLKKAVAGKTAAVIGGGSVAMDCAAAAVRMDPRDVYLIYRRSFAQMPADEDERIEMLTAGVHFLMLNQPVGYLIDGENKITGVKLSRTRLGDPDESGRRRPVTEEGSDWVLPVDVVIEAIGNIPDPASPTWYPDVTVDSGMLIQVDETTGKTSAERIFAGGDIVRGPSLVVHAVQDGKRAARSIRTLLEDA